MVGNEAIVPSTCVMALKLFASQTGKLEVGEGLGMRPGNEAASVRMLALFQYQVKLLSWSDCN